MSIPATTEIAPTESGQGTEKGQSRLFSVIGGALAIATLLATIAGCGTTGNAGANSDPKASDKPTVTEAPKPEASSATSDQSDPNPNVWRKTYDSPAQIVAIIGRQITACKADGPPETTLYSDRAQTCWYVAGDGAEDQMTIATYATEAQQAQALEYLLAPDGGPNPGASYVSGHGFTVATDAQLAPKTAKALGAFVVR